MKTLDNGRWRWTCQAAGIKEDSREDMWKDLEMVGETVSWTQMNVYG